MNGICPESHRIIQRESMGAWGHGRIGSVGIKNFQAYSFTYDFFRNKSIL